MRVSKGDDIREMQPVERWDDGSTTFGPNLDDYLARGYELYVEPPPAEPTLEEIAYQLAVESARVAEAGRVFILEQEIYSTGLMMVDRIRRVEPDNVIAKATDQWVEAASMEVETRKYYVRMGLWPDGDDPADFTLTYPHKPYLISQIKPEYDRLKAAGLIV